MMINKLAAQAYENMMFGPGITKQAGLVKEALIKEALIKEALLGRILSTPVRLFSKRRAQNMQEALDPVISRAAHKYSDVFNTPLNEVKWLPSWARRVGGVEIVPKFIRNRTRSPAFREGMAHNPLLLGTQFSPVLGTTFTYLGINRNIKGWLKEPKGPPAAMIARGDGPLRKWLRPDPLGGSSAQAQVLSGGFGGGGFSKPPKWARYDEASGLEPEDLEWLRHRNPLQYP